MKRKGESLGRKALPLACWEGNLLLSEGRLTQAGQLKKGKEHHRGEEKVATARWKNHVLEFRQSES